jgi:23S rRNA pseudouridine1911/1915/1917 synthase
MAARSPLGQGSKRLDRALLDLGLGLTRRSARELIAAGYVRVNGRALRKGDLVAAGDRVEVAAPAMARQLLANAALAPAVLYQDAAAVIVAKPGLLPCHPLRLSDADTLMNGVVTLFPETAGAGDKPLEGGLVHRLDNGASGAVIVARSPLALKLLREALRSNRIARRYEALALGELTRPLEIDLPIAHHAKDPKRMTLAPAGTRRALRGRPRPAFTRVEPLLRLDGMTLLRVTPHTGVRHQIRLHLAAAKLPLVGDVLYGAPPAAALAPGRFFLHLRRLRFDSPAGALVDVQAPLPADLAGMLDALEAARRQTRRNSEYPPW